MNNELMLNSALELETILKKYKDSHAESRTVLNGLQSLIDDVKNGDIIQASVPFNYAITGGLIVLPKDAESAYSRFSILLEFGGEKYKDSVEWAEEQKKKIFGKG